MLESFFPPNFGWGVLVVALSIFIYQLYIDAGEYIEFHRKKGDRYTWNDVDIKIVEPSKDDNPTIYFEVKNKKSYNINDAHVIAVEITRFWLIETVTGNLGWIKESPEQIWDGIQLLKDEQETYRLPFAFYLDHDEVAFLVIRKLSKDNQDMSYFHLDLNAEYRVKLWFLGKIEDHSMDELYKSYFLKFDGKKIHINEIKPKESKNDHKNNP